MPEISSATLAVLMNDYRTGRLVQAGGRFTITSVCCRKELAVASNISYQEAHSDINGLKLTDHSIMGVERAIQLPVWVVCDTHKMINNA